MKRNYIGLANSCHDGGLAIVNSEGKLIFAEATERYMQNKRAFNIAPDVFMRVSDLVNTYCEPGAELTVAYTWSGQTEGQVRDALAEIDEGHQKAKAFYGEVPAPMTRQIAFNRFVAAAQLNMVCQPGISLSFELAQLDSPRTFEARSYEHHLTHAATACFTSPLEEGLCAILDGYGEGRAFACYRFKNGRIEELEGSFKGGLGSLGLFYMYVCDTCGFGHLAGEEWKVMGLAPYGVLEPEIYALLREMIQTDGLNIRFCSDYRLSQILQQLGTMRRKKGQPPLMAANIAYAGQKVFSEVLFEFLNNLYATGLSENLILGGGCALNSSANGQILQNTPFKNVHIYSAPADDGNAAGAALLAYYEDHPHEHRRPAFQTPYLGSRVSRQSLKQVEDFSQIPGLSRCENAPVRAAELLAEGKIIGWVRGPAEFGPRALGNRSILADPRSPEVKDRINTRIKFREEFRPFAPSILHEYGDEYFENYQPAPYMERTLKFKPEVMSKVPGVVHKDGTGRLQTVKREWNEDYYLLISHFHKLTGIPLVLNTSFNVMGKPISHSVEDALAVFYTSGLDVLFIEDMLIQK